MTPPNKKEGRKEGRQPTNQRSLVLVSAPLVFIHGEIESGSQYIFKKSLSATGKNIVLDLVVGQDMQDT